jgi:hypothetical protein
LLAVYLFLAPNYCWNPNGIGSSAVQGERMSSDGLAGSSYQESVATNQRTPTQVEVYELPATPYGADFLQEWIGAQMIIRGHAGSLYDTETFRKWQHDDALLGFAWRDSSFFPPVYPPIHYALFTPFALIPYRWAVVLWVTALVFCAMLSTKWIVMIARHHARSEDSSSNSESDRAQWFWLALILFPSLLFSITLGQKSCVWLLILCGAWRLLQTRRSLASGLVFGLLSVKPTLFFLVPLVLLWNRQWRFFAGATMSVLALWGGCLFVVPFETLVSFVKLAGQAGNYAESNGYQLDWSCNLMTIAYSMPAGWELWCKWAICFPLAAYIVFACFADKEHPFDSPHKLMMMLCTTLLLSPHTYHYDLCILLLPILWLAVVNWRTSFVYYAMLAIGVAIAAELQSLLHVPAIPILLIGILCELRLRGILANREHQEPALASIRLKDSLAR